MDRGFGSFVIWAVAAGSRGPGSEDSRPTAYHELMEPLSEEQTVKIVAMAMDLARGRTAELLEFIDHGLPVDSQDGEGNTALMLAAYRGHPETVRALVERGADVNLCNNRGQSPIAGALFKGEGEVVTVLRAAGADLDVGTPSARAAAEMFGRAHLLE